MCAKEQCTPSKPVRVCICERVCVFDLNLMLDILCKAKQLSYFSWISVAVRDGNDQFNFFLPLKHKATLYLVCTLCVPCVYLVCTLYVPCVYLVCTLCVPCVYLVCTLCVQV